MCTFDFLILPMIVQNWSVSGIVGLESYARLWNVNRLSLYCPELSQSTLKVENAPSRRGGNQGVKNRYLIIIKNEKTLITQASNIPEPAQRLYFNGHQINNEARFRH